MGRTYIRDGPRRAGGSSATLDWKSIAERLAAAGAQVVLTARSVDELESTVRAIEEVGGWARDLPADVTDRVGVEAVVAEAGRTAGPISLLGNNAGILGPIGGGIGGRWRQIGALP